VCIQKVCDVHTCAGIFKQSMGARNRVGIELSYRPVRLPTQPGGIVSLELILGLLESLKIRALLLPPTPPPHDLHFLLKLQILYYANFPTLPNVYVYTITKRGRKIPGFEPPTPPPPPRLIIESDRGTQHILAAPSPPARAYV
jgi:hypothetical protein